MALSQVPPRHGAARAGSAHGGRVEVERMLFWADRRKIAGKAQLVESLGGCRRRGGWQAHRKNSSAPASWMPPAERPDPFCAGVGLYPAALCIRRMVGYLRHKKNGYQHDVTYLKAKHEAVPIRLLPRVIGHFASETMDAGNASRGRSA